jgi:hypothetical protein
MYKEVNGPTVGVSPLIVRSADTTVPAVLSITSVPLNVQVEAEHDALPTGDRLADTSSVTVSALAVPAPAPNSRARMIHKDFRNLHPLATIHVEKPLE